jgi:uncharacterized membrane protein
MITPLIMLGLLTTPWLLAKIGSRSLQAQRAAAVIGITLTFCFTGLGHFIETKAMAEMMPGWLPGRIAIVYVTGMLEILFAFLVLVPSLRRQIGLVLVGMLVLFLPVNIYAAYMRIPFGGHSRGPIYLMIRVPLQIVLLTWTYWFTVRDCSDEAA